MAAAKISVSQIYHIGLVNLTNACECTKDDQTDFIVNEAGGE